MRRIFKTFTFWFAMVSVLIIVFNILGYDDMNILLISFNPILDVAVYIEPYRSLIWNNGPNLNMYIAHLITYILYGGVLDIIILIGKIVIKKLNNKL